MNELPLFVSIFLRLTDFDNENPSPPMTEGKGTEDQAYETVAPEIPPPRKYACHRSCVRIKHRGGDFDNENPSPPMTEGKGTKDQAYETVAPEIPPPRKYACHRSCVRIKPRGGGKSTSSPSMVGSPEGIYQPGWGVTNSCCLDTPDAFQDVVDHIVAMGSQLRLHFEQEVRLLKKARAQIARRAQRIQMDVCLDALSIDFDEELYPHMLTAIVGRRWVIGHSLRLAVMKYVESIKLRHVFANVVSTRIAKGMSEGLAHGIEHGKAGRGLEVVEAYDPEANNKYLQALQELKDMKEDAPKWIRDLRPSTSQLKILVYLEVRDPRDPLAVKEEMLLEEPIVANVSRAEKKKRCRVVCRTHGVGSAHHARSDGVPISMLTVAPQGLAILLADATTQTETSEDDASLRLFRSKSLPPMYNLD
nr:hypothetical protein [Tanacetum cinerariifolium]